MGYSPLFYGSKISTDKKPSTFIHPQSKANPEKIVSPSRSSRSARRVTSNRELDEKSNVHFLHIATSDKPVKVFSLDIIISVGYRVKSKRGTQFRQWANKVLKEYLLKGYAVNQRFERLEYRVAKTEEKIDFLVRTAIPPVEGIFFEGQIFDAYALMNDLIRSAKKKVVMIDNYIDDTVFIQLDKRNKGVKAVIYTPTISKTLRQDLERHNAQYSPIEIKTYRKAHDRFLIIDDTVYHVGASFKDLGKKLFAFSKMEAMTGEELVKRLEE